MKTYFQFSFQYSLAWQKEYVMNIVSRLENVEYAKALWVQMSVNKKLFEFFICALDGTKLN